jgi:gamma-glutamyltranspeptidase/glutathione hydrolase
MLKRLLSVTLLAGALAAAGPAQPQAAAPQAPASASRYADLPSSTTGMVSAADPRASAAGVEILRAGGSAADAAAATMLALSVVEPQSSGIGGGGFLVYHDAASETVSTLDGRETAPMAATPNYFLDANGQPRPHAEAVPGGLSVGVPGNIRLIERLHEDHGRLPWARLFEPAIRLARDGFAMTPRMRAALESPNSLARMSEWSRNHYYEADGTPKPVGTILRNPELAATLEQIARLGPDWFYVGPNAQALVETARNSPRNPAVIETGDLAAYQVHERPAVCGTYRGYRICGMGPPSSGGLTVFQILKQLERFDLSALGPDSPVAWHLIAESGRLAYADRDTFIGDPDYVDVPIAGMMDETYLAGRSALISPDHALAEARAGNPPGAPARTTAASAEVRSTTHFVVVDRAGNVASYTSTVEGPWGSGLTVGGYVLNNELTDFTFAPVRDGAPVANRPEGGKRPMSSMSPTIVYNPDGSIRLAVGAAGGPTIIAQVAKAIIGVLDWRMSAQEAIAQPFILGWGDRVLVERGTRLEAMAPQLRAMGHQVVPIPSGFKANAIERVDGRWIGAADPRSEGVAIPE